jgi:hypothetical protein
VDELVSQSVGLVRWLYLVCHGKSVPGYHLSILYKIIGRAIILCKIIACALYLYKLIVKQYIYIKVLALAIISTKFPADAIYLYKVIECTIF